MIRVVPFLLALTPFAGCASVDGMERRGGSSVEVLMIAPAHEGTSAPSSTVEISRARARGERSASVVQVVPIDRPVARVASRHDVGGHDAPPAEVAEPTAADEPLPDIVPPHSLARVGRGFGGCRGNRHYHEALDIGGVGHDWGLGKPVRAMTRSRVTFIGRTTDNPGEFGLPDRRGGMAVRSGKRLPRSKVIPGYGRVHFFTRNYGRWRSGNVLVTRGLGGPLDQHEIRYMHLGAVHPKLKVGTVLEPGEELGLMGGTAVMSAPPHVHIDIEDPNGQRIDVAPLLGLPPTARQCPEPKAEGRESRVWTKRIPTPACGSSWTREEDFASGEFYAHDVELELGEGDRLFVSLTRAGGDWKPRVELLDGDGATVYMGSTPTSGSRGGGLKAHRKLSGRRGREAAVTVTALEEGDVVVRVTAWPAEKPGLLLPKDGEYTLTLERSCAE